MNKLHDPELELFKRAVDLVDYAKKAGYAVRPDEGAPGLTVLDHPNRDRIVVGRSPMGPWVYAAVADYRPRAPDEPAEQALSRLRLSIHRSADRGTVVEFVQERHWSAQREQVSLEIVRGALRDFRAHGLPLDFGGALRPPPYGPRPEQARAASRNPTHEEPAHGPGAPGDPTELNRRRYDWSRPIPTTPRAPEGSEPLRRARQAQPTIEGKVHAPHETAAPERSPSTLAPPGPTSSGRSETVRSKSELDRRRYDWAPVPEGIEAIRRAGRSPDRGR